MSAVAAFSLLQSMVLPALPEIRIALHASAVGSAWVLSAFLLVSSVAAVVVGRLGDIYGKKRLLAISVLALLVGSVVAALSPSIGVLITSRCLQGVGAAAFPLAYGLARELLPPERVPAAIGAISSTFGIGFAVGLILPAPLLAAGGWPAVFWASAIVDLVSLALILVTIPESARRTRESIDWSGAALLALALSCGLLAISEARAWILPLLLLLAAASVLSIGCFVRLELRTAEPLVQIRLLARPAVAAADAAGLLIGFALYGAFSVVPEFVQIPADHGFGLGASSLEAGLLLLPTAVVMVLVGPVAGRLGTRTGHARVLAAAGIMGVVGYGILVAAPGSIWAIIASTSVLGLAVGLALTASVNLIVGSVDSSTTGQATGLNTILRTIGGALGAQIMAVLIASTASTSTPDFGYRIAFAVCGAALAAVAVIAVVAGRSSRDNGHRRSTTRR